MMVLAAEIDFADGTEYVATIAWATSGSDTPANTLFRARLSDAAYERSVSFAVHRGDRSPVAAVQELVLLNADGRLNGWLDRSIRDRTVIIKTGRIDQPYSTWTVRQRATVDRISQANRTQLVIRFKSKLAKLDKEATASWTTAPNPEIVGTRLPIVIGRLFYAGGVLHEHASNFERFYAISDWPVHSISVWWSRYNTVTPGYYVQGIPEAIYGLRRRSTTTNPGPDDRMCLEMRGAIRLGTELLGGVGEFKAWSGGYPVGWTSYEGSGTIVESPGGCARLDGEDVSITWTGLTVGVLYYVEVLTNTVDGGVWEIRNGATVLHYQPYDAFFAASPRAWRLTFTATATTIVIAIPVGATGTVSIDRVRCWPATPVDRARGWLEHLLLDRGTLVAGDVDTSSFDALQTAKPYDLAFANQEGSELDDLLWRMLDSLNAGVYEGLDGKLRATWLQSPAGMTPVGVISDDDYVESWDWEDDEADGLSTQLQYAVNYAQLTENEIQSIQSVVTLTQATVESLRRGDRKVTAAIGVHSHYTRAADQPPAPSLIVSQADAQTECNARATLYNQRRRWGRCSLRDMAKYSALDVGQCWTVESAAWGTFRVFVTSVGGYLAGTVPVITLRVWR